MAPGAIAAWPQRDHSTQNTQFKLIAEGQAPMGGRRERAGGNFRVLAF